mmetsp:Transcript_3156/g.9213  ORF Transcript_3156/g.9213 Transcript_3156/m.9213 type:complete len:432 (-) Transcript_3156:105-1400(-)
MVASRSRSRSKGRPPDSLANEIEAFLKAEPEIEERAATMLRSKPPEVQKLVIARGGLAGTRNPTAVLVSRIRNAEEGLRPVLDTERAPEEIERFLIIERVEPHAAARLRRASKAVQQAVVSRGSLAGTRDPTAVLMTRIRDAEKENQPTPEAIVVQETIDAAAAANPYGSDPQAYALAYYAQYQQAYPQAVQGAYAGVYPGAGGDASTQAAQLAAAYAAYQYPAGYYAYAVPGYMVAGAAAADATQAAPPLEDGSAEASQDGEKPAAAEAASSENAGAAAAAAGETPAPVAPAATDAAAAATVATMAAAPAAYPAVAGYPSMAGYAAYGSPSYGYPAYPQMASVYPSMAGTMPAMYPQAGMAAPGTLPGMPAGVAPQVSFAMPGSFPQIPGFPSPPPPGPPPPPGMTPPPPMSTPQCGVVPMVAAIPQMPS